MPNIPTWALGKHAGTITLTGQTVATDGTLTDATGTGTQSLLTIWDEIDLENNPETEEISASDSTKQHTVVLKDAFTMRCTQVIQRVKPSAGAQSGANAKANPLAWMQANYDYYKAVVAFSGAGGGDAWTTYLARGPFSHQHRKGRSISTMTFNPVDSTAGATTAATTYASTA